MRSIALRSSSPGAGVLTFGVVFTVLQVTRSDAAPEPRPRSPLHADADHRAPGERFAHSEAWPPARSPSGVPSTGSEPLLLGVQPGDRLDVLASLPSPADSRPVTAVVVSGATVLRAAAASDPLLLEVSGPDASCWRTWCWGAPTWPLRSGPEGGNPPTQQPLDEQAARALLGLPGARPAGAQPAAT